VLSRATAEVGWAFARSCLASTRRAPWPLEILLTSRCWVSCNRLRLPVSVCASASGSGRVIWPRFPALPCPLQPLNGRHQSAPDIHTPHRWGQTARLVAAGLISFCLSCTLFLILFTRLHYSTVPIPMPFTHLAAPSFGPCVHSDPCKRLDAATSAHTTTRPRCQRPRSAATRHVNDQRQPQALSTT
jgi:hypothetical protein